MSSAFRTYSTHDLMRLQKHFLESLRDISAELARRAEAREALLEDLVPLQQMARQVGISRATLYRMIERYGLVLYNKRGEIKKPHERAYVRRSEVLKHIHHQTQEVAL